ncbi:MAG TPA: helix-turn-helix transcriptional regulator [Polyangia bacterium]|nr:helix-turn-helix transcriptional regulator [Thermoleophilia bacterium]HUT79488.1 helix-turn-helix transcriptional regulator [Polyangia bacterium]
MARQTMTLAARLLAEEAAGVKRATIAEALGISKRSVLNLLRGGRPKIGTAGRAARFLGVPLEDISNEWDK